MLQRKLLLMRFCPLFLLCPAAILQAAATPLSVQQLQRLLESAVRASSADDVIARRLARIELSERLSGNRLDALRRSTPGPKAREALELLSYASEFLDPPLEDLVGEPPPAASEQTAILAKAGAYARQYVRNLPNFICTAITRRMDDDPDTGSREIWNHLRLNNTITGELSFNGGKESYKVQKVSRGKETAQEGLGTSGEFGNIIEALFLFSTPDMFQWRHWEMLHGRRVAVFGYSLDSDHSRFTLSTGGRPNYRAHGQPPLSSITTAYVGELSIDPVAGAILRVTRKAVHLPRGFPIRRMETAVDFEPVDIGGTYYVLPIKSITLSDFVATVGAGAVAYPGTGGVLIDVPRKLLNEVQFRGYRKFGAESVLIAGDMPPSVPDAPLTAEPQAAAPTDPGAALPADQQQAVATFRSASRLVEVSVVVRDKLGRPVTDLRKQDFEVFDEGKQQSIRVFKPADAGLPPAPGITSRDRSNSPVFSNRTEASMGSNSVAVILFDQLNTIWEDQAWAREAIIRFLRQISVEDRVGIYLMRIGGFQVLRDFTEDSAALVKSLASWDGRSDLLRLSSGVASQAGFGRELARWLSGKDPAYRSYQIAGFPASFNLGGGTIEPSLKVLEAVAAHLAGVPGRKNLIWVSAGFPQYVLKGKNYFPEVVAAMKAMTNANIAMYPVDARGLVAGYATAELGQLDGPKAAVQAQQPDTEGVYKKEQLMWNMADRTGGKAYTSANDIASAIRSAFEDSRFTYTLGFYPEDMPFDDRFRSLTVSVPGRKDVTLLHRKGYVAAIAADDPKRQLGEALWSPLDASGIAISARLTLNDGNWHVNVTIGPDGLGLLPEHDHWTGQLSVVLAQKNQAGDQIGYLDEELGLDLKQDTYAVVSRSGLEYERSISAAPDVGALRIIVRNLRSGNLGSLTIPFTALTRTK